MTSARFFSVVIPVLDGGDDFIRCLDALRASTCEDWELIVVDDGSRDQSASIARRYDAKVLQTGGPHGPAAARNRGAAVAEGEYLFFVDADCELHADTLEKAREILRSHPDVDGLFGSYDSSPSASGAVSQFKNLFHHWLHQEAPREATTFWAGCGALRRAVFREVGGFDAVRYPLPSIEDIELGYRLHAAGARVLVAKDVQVRHRKRWRLLQLIRTDVLQRGVPWTRLLLERRLPGRGLNLGWTGRLSVVLVAILLICAATALLLPELAFAAILALVLLVLLNHRLYGFFLRCRGARFLAAAVPLHLLYCFYSGLAYLLGRLYHVARV